MQDYPIQSGSGESQTARTHAHAPLVVGIGGSAGALQALITLLQSLGSESRLAIVVVLHLSPDHESHAVEILQRHTPLVVEQVTERTWLRHGHVYVIAPGTWLITEDGHIQPGEASSTRPSAVIDLFFRTLAEVHRENAVGVVLSGTGRDGSLGLKHIKERGGVTIGQAIEDCEHADMPRAAQSSGGVDLMLAASDIGKRLSQLADLPHPRPGLSSMDDDLAEDGPSGAGEESDRAFHEILAALRVRTRHDFRHYKRATLHRRLERRIQVNGLSDISAYLEFVRGRPQELSALLADMLISVTNFYRDPPAFEALRLDVIPRVLEAIPEDEEARIWIPACASGEESYSVAIAFQEYIDHTQRPRRLQVFASDINDAALGVARAGVYPANIAADVSEQALSTYFEKEDEFYRVRAKIREMIVFARHNVLSDPPFSRLDLICCRNLLIYLDRTAQAAVLNTFAYALNPGGYLFLGNAESADAAGDTFETVSKEHRIYRVRPQSAYNGTRLLPRLVETTSLAPLTSPSRAFGGLPDKSLAALHERAVAANSPPSVLISADYDIERVSPGAGRFITFGEGAPTRNLLTNVPADIRLELTTLLFRANASGSSAKTVFKRESANNAGGGDTLTITIHPVRAEDTQPLHWLVLFEQKPSESEAESAESQGDMVSRATLEALEAENRSLKLHLQDTLHRSAMSTEELKASNEELQAINEELRSAKEELETSKEELQSINEELSTVNSELRINVEEGNRNNDDLRNLMEASDIATIFVDPAIRVKRFTPKATKLFSLIASDIGRPLADVKSRLDYGEIIEDATAAFRQLQPVERSVTGNDNEHYLARVVPYRTGQDKIGGAVLTFVDVTALRKAEKRVEQSEDRLRAAIASSKDFAVISTDNDGLILTWNDGARAIFGHTEEEILGQSIDVLFTPEDRARGIPDQERRVAQREGRASDERWHLRKDGTMFFCSGVMTTVTRDNGRGYIKIARDISAHKHREEQQEAELGSARESVATAQVRSDMRDRFLAVMSHELKQPLNVILVNTELLVRTPQAQASPQLKRIGETIMRAVDAQVTIVNDLLDLSRVQTGKLHLRRQPTDLRDIIQRFGEAMALDARQKNIAMSFELPALPLFCVCDPVRIEQVVWNLMGNAIKFTPDGGAVNVSLQEEDDYARVAVADNGIGIAAEFLPNVFELFNQGDAPSAPGQRRPGLGIGLSLVRELVVAHDGRVDATSEGRGKGSTFTVWLPLREPVSGEVADAQPAAPMRCKILMVDDDVETIATLAALMEIEGANVATTTSGSEALEMLRSGEFDVLVSDIGMPEMTGHELMRQASKLRPEKTFRSVALTGYGSEADERDALAAGFDAFVTKPISVSRLRATLEELCNTGQHAGTQQDQH